MQKQEYDNVLWERVKKREKKLVYSPLGVGKWCFVSCKHKREILKGLLIVRIVEGLQNIQRKALNASI